MMHSNIQDSLPIPHLVTIEDAKQGLDAELQDGWQAGGILKSISSQPAPRALIHTVQVQEGRAGQTVKTTPCCPLMSSGQWEGQ